jgi:hypothetical protein
MADQGRQGRIICTGAPQQGVLHHPELGAGFLQLPPEPGHILYLQSLEIRQDADLRPRHLLLDCLDYFGFL